MNPPDAADAANRYCRRLGLAVPDLDTAVKSPDVTIAQMMALAVLEAGGPLTLEAIAERLLRLHLPPRLEAARHLASLRKAWHGQSPLVRDAADGRFYLDLLSHHAIRWLAYTAGCFGVPFARLEPTVFQLPPDTVPLSHAEVEAAFRDRTLYGYSLVRRAAAMLEAGGRRTTTARRSQRRPHGPERIRRQHRRSRRPVVEVGPGVDGIRWTAAPRRRIAACSRDAPGHPPAGGPTFAAAG